MTGSVVHFPCTRDAGKRSRLWPAFAFSAAAHLSLALVLAPEIPLRSALSPDFPAITVGIEHVPASGELVADEPLKEPAEPRPHGSPVAPVDVAATDARQENVAPGLSASLPLIPDPTVYDVRDLDSYPRPVAPLDVGRYENSETGGSAAIRFELTIDERGAVSEIVLTGSRAAGTVEADLRSMLAATRFIPARKEGRAVKSRVLLSINLAKRRDGR
jgi:hypothetical protein